MARAKSAINHLSEQGKPLQLARQSEQAYRERVLQSNARSLFLPYLKPNNYQQERAYRNNFYGLLIRVPSYKNYNTNLSYKFTLIKFHLFYFKRVN
ncbi:MAG: hypothetical protein F6J93_35950 [Oscillatoria sp. SIO1A7]|nr:hypothetical protein [Oscillatoria sp. SIO1A7]